MSQLEKRINRDLAAIYSRRRVLAEKRCELKRAQVYQQYPELEAIDRRIQKAGISELYRSLGDDCDDHCLESVIREREDFMKSRGIEVDYDSPEYYCTLCNDSGSLPSGEWCPCRRRLFQKEISRYLPIPFQEDAKFANFNLNLFSDQAKEDGLSPREHMSRLRNEIVFYTRHFSQVQDQNLLFSGQAGTGKTFLMQSIGREVLDMDYSVLYVTAPIAFEWMKTMSVLRQSYNPDRAKFEEMELLTDALMSVDLLLLDDLGSEISASWTVTDNTPNFLTLLDTRLHKSLHSIIATNLSEKDLHSTYDKRTYSRLMGDYIFYRFPDDDIRLKQRHHGQ
ncbi:MAG: ATP-binding protein [Eubacteriales bacterium]|nr:ATP-binding protein [Eubacteriales bacterium]MDD4323347.1 ATP-binding protein [Eubacteriales bacterium]MDD4540935.1 ATP-binding protein [Eubacteriales bacterium]